tara:strand:- start:1554 stop:2603 length:1050 start_codon:yes stop_codon:yes gene_type:complete
MGGDVKLAKLKFNTASNIAILLLIAVLAIVHLKSILQPLVVAILLFFLIRPPAEWLEKKLGRHPFLAYGALVGIIMAFLFVASNILFSNLQSFTEEVPSLSEKLQNKLLWFEDNATILGFSFDTSEVTGLITVEKIESFATGLVGSLASFTAGMVTVLIFLLFIILEAETLPKRIKAAYPEDVDRIIALASSSSKGINVYVVTRASVAFGQAVLAAIILYFFGIPGWFLWACITFMMDFIPYVGALISLLFPIILGLIILSPSSAVLLIILLIANQQLWGGVIEPQIAGKRLDISPIVLLLLVAFWGWAWGVMGMILGVPLAVIMKRALESDPRTKPIAMMLSMNPKSD